MEEALTKTNETSVEIATALKTLISEVVNKSEINNKDNFFAIGGDSMSAITLIHAIEQNYGVRLPLAELFELKTIGKIITKTIQLIDLQG